MICFNQNDFWLYFHYLCYLQFSLSVHHISFLLVCLWIRPMHIIFFCLRSYDFPRIALSTLGWCPLFLPWIKILLTSILQLNGLFSRIQRFTVRGRLIVIWSAGWKEGRETYYDIYCYWKSISKLMALDPQFSYFELAEFSPSLIFLENDVYFRTQTNWFSDFPCRSKFEKILKLSF